MNEQDEAVVTATTHEIKGWEFVETNYGKSFDYQWGLMADMGWHAATPVLIRDDEPFSRELAIRVAALLRIAEGVPTAVLESMPTSSLALGRPSGEPPKVEEVPL